MSPKPRETSNNASPPSLVVDVVGTPSRDSEHPDSPLITSEGGIHMANDGVVLVLLFLSREADCNTGGGGWMVVVGEALESAR